MTPPKPKNALDVQIGIRLIEARKRAGYSDRGKFLQTLAGKLKESTLSNYENGIRRPGLEEAMLLSRCYGAPASYLLCIDEETSLTPQERDLLRNFRALPERDRNDYARRIGVLSLAYREPVPDETPPKANAPKQSKDDQVK